LSVFLVLLCVFTDVACLVLYGTENAFFTSIVVMSSSHNIAASLCCHGVDCFILAVAILRYDYKPALNIIIIKKSMLFVSHELAFEFALF
jgi:hypothetical protein